MAIKEFTCAGRECLHQAGAVEKVYKIVAYSINHMLMKTSDGDFRELTPIEYKELMQQEKLRVVETATPINRSEM